MCAVLGISLLSPQPTRAGGGGGNGMAMIMMVGAGLLIWHGVSNLGKDWTTMQAKCDSGVGAAGCPTAIAKVGFDVLEIGGGAVALMAAMKNDSETKSDGSSDFGSPSGGGSPSGYQGGIPG